MLKTYLRELSLRRQAHIWLKNNNPHAIAARSLFKLNRHARADEDDRDLIYRLKTPVIKAFCARFPPRVRTQIQKRYCHACGGSGVYWTGQDCYRCDGTGVYSVTHLHLFEFNISGVTYLWHQLSDLVSWPVEMSNQASAGKFKDLCRSGVYLEPDHRRLLVWTLYEYLRMFAPDDAPEITLTAGRVLRFWVHRHDLRIYAYRLVKWLMEHNFKPPSAMRRFAGFHTWEPVDDDEIPF